MKAASKTKTIGKIPDGGKFKFPTSETIWKVISREKGKKTKCDVVDGKTSRNWPDATKVIEVA